ncbi:protein MFI [Heteronotia binoei]|uniref:protein MFI n=1 Tax=Heteronotia binoei TaxID=13085 RepID=UPI0029306701|nr:protein MFI [Heteronotia binoei]XP_060090832.1 protein MFI [Heteronotia binoei]
MTKPERFLKPMGEAEALADFYYYEEEQKREKAANIIQRCWKRWLDVGVFEYYKDLIGFKQCGEPARLMRYIEPKEAEYLDAAAGVHIRFRLGGAKFPPCIYYKVFTHRPIVDMCANSPKNYAQLSVLKAQRGKSQGDNKEDLCGWYQRLENNGWRLLSPRFWKALDSITAEDNVKVKEFHCNKLKKKEEMMKKRKRRKIEWLQQMYFGQHLQVKTLDPTETFLIQRATQGLITCLGDEGLDSVMEWEVDEMLKWTTALNYEEYVKQWKALGTSKLSEDFSGFWFTEHHKPSELSEIQEAAHKAEPLQQTPSLMKKPSVRRSLYK